MDREAIAMNGYDANGGKKGCKNISIMDFDFDSVDMNAIRKEVGAYMDKYVYNFEGSSFGQRFNV